MKYDGPFEAVNIKTMIELAAMLDEKESLSLEDKYMLSNAPINTRSPLILNGYKKYVNSILNHTVTRYRPSTKTSGIAKTQLELLQAEDEVKKISLYLWLSYKLPELFPDKQKAEQFRIELNYFCENSLKSNKTLTPMQRRGGNRNQSRSNYRNKDNKHNSRSDQNPRRRDKYKGEQKDSRDSESSKTEPRRRSRRRR